MCKDILRTCKSIVLLSFPFALWINLLPSLFSFFKSFLTAPYVFVTAVHQNTNKHDAASVWAEDVTTSNFRACLRELKNFDGAHKYLSVVRSYGSYTWMFKRPSCWGNNSPFIFNTKRRILSSEFKDIDLKVIKKKNQNMNEYLPVTKM